jgi:non-ribosomal peptide synthetase-like protein
MEPRTFLQPGAGSSPTALLHELFRQTAAAYPDETAVVCRGVTWTYRDLDLASDRLARRLRHAGVRRGDHVGLLLPRSGDVYVALLAVLKAGAAYVPLDPDYPAERVLHILQNCRARSLITHSELASLHAGYDGDVLALDNLGAELARLGDDPLSPDETGVTPFDTCYLIYTSGTTGQPKGVQIEHRSACHLVRAEGQIFGVGPSDRVFQGFSIAFDASVEEVWLAFSTGAALVVGTKEMVQAGPALARTLTEAGVTVFSTVPTLLALIDDELPSVRLLILGGEACPQDLVNRWCRPGRRMVNTYGPTEATVIATFADCHPDRPVTIGRPVPGYSVRLLDDRMRPVPPGEAGEIFIGGPGLARGYLGFPELTREKFVDNPFQGPDDPWPRLYRSGDLGRYNADGEIEFAGRIDSQVKLRGFRIELSEVESVLLECPGVLACAVAHREDVEGLPELVAYAVPRGQARLEPRAVLGALRTRLPAYMVPSRLVTLDALPTLPSGKVDRRSLPAPLASVEERATDADPAGRTELERKIARVWSKTFAPLPVTVHDDFFHDLGGHSLLAARVVSELRSDPDLCALSVVDLYKHPTIEALAAKLEEDRAATVGTGNGGAGIGERKERGAQFRQATNRSFILCGLAQVVGLYFVVGFFSLQWLAPYLTYTWMVEHDAAIVEAIFAALAVLMAVYPAMLAASVVVKWLVVGRYKAGEHPLWGVQYLRWWFVQSIHEIVPVSYLEGTPLLNWYYRLLGARIGANVHIGSSSLAAFDLTTIGDDTCIGSDTELSGYSVEDGLLKIGPVTIGRGCTVGNRVVLREQTVIEDGARLDDLSLLPRGARLPRGERWAGSPARRVARRAPWTGASAAPRPGIATRFAFGVLHLLGQFLFPMVVIGAVFPGLILMNELRQGQGGYSYLLAAPAVAVSFVVLLCLEIALAKWLLLGRVKAGTYELHSGFYVRKWFVDQLMELSLDVIGPLYATIYLSPWYRLLGARLGRRAEVSTASFISPDLLTLGDEGFIADAVSLGAARVADGRLTVAEVRVGRRAFVGNSALLPPGTVVGERGLIGCLSVPPATIPGAATASTAWLGSPAVFLPQRQETTRFDDQRTFNPTPKLWAQRALIDFFRVTLPSTFFILLTSLLLSAFLRLRADGFSTAAVVALFPMLYAAIGVAAGLIVVALKWVLMGRYKPGEHPLWSTFVWRTELVTSLFENLARLFLVERLVGTPFLAWYLRLLGAKIGRRVFLNSSELTEFDLVEIGDDAALNEECTVQTHLFEDRVMKMSTVRIGPRCSVGSQAVVLYDTEMREGSSLDSLSLLMKGEVLPPWTRWEGSPARARESRQNRPASPILIETC